MKKKILITLTRCPYPAIDGTRFKHLHNLIEGLYSNFEIDLCIVGFETVSKDQISFLKKHYCNNVFVLKISKISFVFNAIITAVFRFEPLQVGGFYNKKNQKWFDDHVEKYDAVYVHTIRLVKYFAKFSKKIKQKILVDFNDAISSNYFFSISYGGFLKKLFYRIEGRLVKKFEKKTLKNFYNFNTVTEKDKNILLSYLKNNVNYNVFSVVNHGVLLHSFQNIVNKKEIVPKIFFLGQLNYRPNKDAVSFFIKNIFPLVKECLPNIEFVVIGKGRRPNKVQDGVVYTGFVEDVLSLVKNYTAFVAPIRIGAGVPSKIIDAMSMGVPVIATPFGIKPFEKICIDKDVLVCEENDPKSWALNIKRLFTDIHFHKNLSKNAFEYVSKNLSLHKVQKDWLDLFESISDKNPF